jgi:transposase
MVDDKLNSLSGNHADWLITRLQTDFISRGLVAELAANGVQVDYGEVWRFVCARGLSL